MSGATSASFVYDCDGNRVKSVMGGVTTYYVGNYSEWTGSTTSMVKYYYAGSQRVAMRVCTGTNGSCGPNGATSTLTYLHADHLGSASLSTSITGSVVSEMRYYPYGETRSGAMPTDRQYTGQRREIGLGLYDYNARYYDPTLGRFLSADSIVPSPANPQSLNRYAYTLNNPLRYTDPTGHFEEKAVIDYLKQHYDHWWDIWTAWLQNTAWMSMLREAVPGDIFAALNDGEPIWLEFCGESKDVLSGAVITSQPINGRSTGRVSLDDYQRGALGAPVAGLLRRDRAGGGYSVKETLPYVHSQDPTGFHFELSTRVVGKEEAFALRAGRTLLIALVAKEAEAVGLMVQLGEWGAFGVGVVTEFIIEEVFNDYGFQAGDREVAISGITDMTYGFAGSSARAYTFWHRPSSSSK